MVEPLALKDAAGSALPLRVEELPDIELQLLLEALLRYGGCDYRHFNQAVLRRRIADAMRAYELRTISALQDLLLHDERAFASFVASMRGPGDGLFGDPSFLRSFSVNVLPLLRTYPFIRIWIPGCGTGAYAYSIAALLAQADVLGKSLIYATCLNDAAVAVAKTSRCVHPGREELEARSRQAGLEVPATEYFEIGDNDAAPRDEIRGAVMIARHDPSGDGSINEFVAIFARGLLPLYNGAIQYRLHRLFLESLGHLGFLMLGPGEDLAGTVHQGAFRHVVADQPIFRRMR
ncbi:MAG: CheR family methyltransferase [Candidatus Tyrphobacter sp.]